MTAFIIIVALIVTLVIVIPLLERSNFRLSAGQISKVSRWILPLCALALAVRIIMHYTGN